MDNDVKCDVVNVASLFENNGIGYKIPSNQRLYQWDKSRVIELLDDITEHYKDDDNDDIISVVPYYLGLMIMYDDISTDVRKYFIHDGHQRFTTLQLIIASVYDLLKDQKGYEKTAAFYLKYLHRDRLTDSGMLVMGDRVLTETEDYDTIFKNIVGSNYKQDINNMKKTTTGSKLLNARESIDSFFKRKINDGIFNYKDIVLFIKYILERVQIIKFVTKNEESAHQFFETINNRGKKIEDHDSLKNYCSNEMSETNTDKFNEEWNSLINLFENGSGGFIVTPDTFLHDYMISRNIKCGKHATFSKFKQEIKKDIEGLNDDDKDEYILKFVGILYTYAYKYVEFCKGIGGNDLRNRCLSNISQLQFKQGRPLLLAASHYWDNNSKEFDELCIGIERVGASYVLGGARTNTFKSEVDKLCRLVSSKKDIDFNEAVDLLYNLSLLNKDSLSNIKNLKCSKLKKKIKKEDKNKIIYVLNKVSYVLQKTTFTSNYDLDHIEPESTKNKNIDKDLLLSIGNLTFLSDSDNRLVQDKSFEDKKLIYKDSACILSRSLVEDIIRFPDSKAITSRSKEIFNYHPPEKWDNDDIEHRSNRIIDLFKSMMFDRPDPIYLKGIESWKEE
jgi:uncharacterized protein with ParB-like and HNH nuclease domain